MYFTIYTDVNRLIEIIFYNIYYRIKNKKMSMIPLGVEITPVVCSNYKKGSELDEQYTKYRDGGLKVLAESFLYWAWFFTIMPWLFAVRMDKYLTSMRELIRCGIENNVKDTKYGNVSFLENTFEPRVTEIYSNALDHLLIFWHPGITYTVMFIPFLNLIGAVAYLGATIPLEVIWSDLLTRTFHAI